MLNVDDLLEVMRIVPNNSSVAGYAVEGVVLSYIADRGLDLGLVGRYPLMDTRGFADTPYLHRTNYETILHLPETSTFRRSMVSSHRRLWRPLSTAQSSVSAGSLVSR